MDSFQNPLITLPADAGKDSPEVWSIDTTGDTKDRLGEGRLTDIMNSTVHMGDPTSSTVTSLEADKKPRTVDTTADKARARKRRASSEARLAQNAKAQKRYRAKLKNEKQQLVDTVEALSKRVQRLEESTGTVVKQPPTSAEHPSSTVSSSAPGLVTCATAAAAAATTPEYSPFADIAGVAPKQCSPSTSNLTGMPSDALHDVHRLFTVNYNTQMELHIASAASKLSTLLDGLRATKQSTELIKLESHSQTPYVADPMTESLLQQEIKTFVDRKSQLRAKFSNRPHFENGFLQGKQQHELPQQHDDALLHTLTALIKAGMEHCDTDLHKSASSPSSVVMPTNNRLEQLAAHREAYVVGVRKLMLHRKACYAELNNLAKLQLERVGSLSHGNKDGEGIQESNGKDGSETEATCWIAREKELLALSLATERLHHNIGSHVKHIVDYADGAMLEVLPPAVGARLVVASATWLKQRQLQQRGGQQHRGRRRPTILPLFSFAADEDRMTVLSQTISRSIEVATEELLAQYHQQAMHQKWLVSPGEFPVEADNSSEGINLDAAGIAFESADSIDSREDDTDIAFSDSDGMD